MAPELLRAAIKKARIKNLTDVQARVWRAARAYTKAELVYAECEECYRSSGDPSLMPWAESRRQRAASRLFQLIQLTPMLDPLE